MKNYEVTFIVDPVLSREEIDTTAQTYVDHLKNEGCKIVHVDRIGLRQLAYPINKRTSGEYYCIEFETPEGQLIEGTELALRRDERIMRFLTVHLDKYGVKYNEDKRNGLIGKKKKKKKEEDEDKGRDQKQRPGQRERGGGRSRAEGRTRQQPKPEAKPKAAAEEEE